MKTETNGFILFKDGTEERILTVERLSSYSIIFTTESGTYTYLDTKPKYSMYKIVDDGELIPVSDIVDTVYIAMSFRIINN